MKHYCQSLISSLDEAEHSNEYERAYKLCGRDNESNDNDKKINNDDNESNDNDKKINNDDNESNDNDKKINNDDNESNGNDKKIDENDKKSNKNDKKSNENDKESTSCHQSHSKEKFINLDRFYVVKLIGHGKFGKVFQIKETKTNNYFAAKILYSRISDDFKNDEKSLLFFREVKLMSAFNHPSIINFIGYSPVDFQQMPHSTIITEYAPNGSLKRIIKLEASGLSPKYWDETRKLINIFGIASGMLYLHSHNVIHRDLKPDNILVDDYLLPRIADFGLSKELHEYENLSLAVNSRPCAIGTPVYMPPESLSEFKYSKPGDVFAFSIVLYELFTLKNPYNYSDFRELYGEVVLKGKRPNLTPDIPLQYQKLISKCWDQNPKKRPTFQEIVDDLKKNKDYLTESIRENEYYDYIDLIENTNTSFELEKSIRFKDIAESIKRNANIEDKTESDDFEEDEEDKPPTSTNCLDENEERIDSNNFEKNERNDNSCMSNKENSCIRNEDAKLKNNFSNDSTDLKQKIAEKEKNVEMIDPNFYKTEKIVEKEKIVEMIDPDQESSYELFLKGKNMIEGVNEIEQDIDGGIELLKKSINENCLDALIYYCRLLVSGKIIPRNLETAKTYLQRQLNSNNSDVLLLYGKVLLREKQFTEAKKMIKKSVKKENSEAMFEYGKLLYCGRGCVKNKPKAMKYFHLSQEKRI